MILFACALITAGTLFYIFYMPGEVYSGGEKTRLSYLQERKDAVYENLRDLNFEYKVLSGKDRNKEIDKLLKANDYLVILDEKGQELSSPDGGTLHVVVGRCSCVPRTRVRSDAQVSATHILSSSRR